MSDVPSQLGSGAQAQLRQYNGKSVLVTGHTGFKGSWLCHLLHRLGARVSGLSLAPPTEPSHFALTDTKSLLVHDLRADVRDGLLMRRALELTQPEIVFHLAAAATVKEGIAEPVATFATNVIGTLNVLEAIRHRGATCTAIIVTSDKCYDNPETLEGLRESDPMGGKDPYSASKGACELAVHSWRHTYALPTLGTRTPLRIASARAGNVIGGGDWGDARLVPDIARAADTGTPVFLRSPSSIRPWQHVLEPLTGYLQLAIATMHGVAPHALNFGPPESDETTVHELCEVVARELGVCIEVAETNPIQEVKALRLNSALARATLGWSPRWTTEQAAQRTGAWYARRAADPLRGPAAATAADIDAYWGVSDDERATTTRTTPHLHKIHESLTRSAST